MTIGTPSPRPRPTNSGFDYRETLPEGTARQTVLQYLACRYPHSSLHVWRSRIQAGQVRLDTRRASPESVVCRGQQLVWSRPPWKEPHAPLFFIPVYEDRHLLAVAKPPGLPTLPGAGYLDHTLLTRVRRYCPAAAPVHRLGRWTSGLVLFARTTEARRSLMRAWRAGEVRKHYRALASGRPSRQAFTIDHPIGPVPHARLGTVHAASRSGKPSRTHVTLVQQQEDGFLADVSIETGRPHQIRIHLACAGHPLLGDPLFARGGLPAHGSRALPGDPGYRLHATRLHIPHPSDGRFLVISCPPPPELEPASD